MASFIDFLAAMPFWYWFVFAIVLLVIELSTGSTYFLWPAIAAALVGLMALVPITTWQSELIMFAAITVVLSIVAPAHVKPWLHRSQEDHQNLNDRGAQKVGRKVTVETTFENGVGKVRMGDTAWLAEAVHGENFEEGVNVEVVRVEGTRVFVQQG